MQTRTREAGISVWLAVGLLTLAGFCFDAHEAPAQGLTGCPLPEGVEPPPDPAVTAQQVEDGSATLQDFALTVRDYETESRYLGCLLRLEGSAWRSGSTYIVELTLDGRILLHTKNMALAGHLLRPEIFGAILAALGAPPDVLAGLVSPDPATAAQAAGALAGILSQGRHAAFEAPGIPGASGYAVASAPEGSLFPIVVLTGFDIDESHLADEVIDYGDPTITAEEVVDRATLKEFVTQAGEFIRDLLESGDLAAMSRSRLAFRDPDGPWRHDPVYLAVLDPVNLFIMFHAAFPDRFEIRRGGIARDVATGELVVEQLVRAANSSPEGGFWLYHFDNPSDDSDSEDTPKVGYARVITSNIPLPDGTTAPTDFIFNSGFYLTTDSVFVQRLLAALADGETSILFGVTTPEDGDTVAGDAVVVSATAAPTDTVHFASRPAGSGDAFTYLGAASNRDGVASFSWDTLDLPDDDYELVALYADDEGTSVVYDSVEVSIDNDADGRGGGGCTMAPLLPGGGGPADPTLPALVGLVLAWLLLARRRSMSIAVLRTRAGVL